MACKFNLKLRHLGASQFDVSSSKDGKVIANKITGEIENIAYNAAGQMIAEKTEEATKRNLFLSAMFFQRVVARTPRDETYITGVNNRGKLTAHKADDDYVQDCWTASYGNSKITAKELRENCGCEFLKFNDRTEVKKIYEQFLKMLGNRAVASGKATLRSVNIENTHERFPMLEYGEYEHDGTIKSGEHYKHGVKNGYSIQAPVGMLRLTQQEFEDTAFNISTEDLMMNARKWQRGLKKAGSFESVKKVLKGKSKISFKEACEIAEAYR